MRIPLLKEYQCDSLFEEDDDGWFLNQSYHCFATQRDQLAERVKRLEDAGDRMAAELNRQCAPHWEDSLARLWRAAKTGVRPVDQVEASACADQAGTPVVSPVSTETAGEQLRRVNARLSAIRSELGIFRAQVRDMERTESDLEELAKRLEREVEVVNSSSSEASACAVIQDARRGES